MMGRKRKSSFHGVERNAIEQQGHNRDSNDDNDARFDDSRSQLALTSLRARKQQRKAKRHAHAHAHTQQQRLRDEAARLHAENERLRKQLAMQQQQQQAPPQEQPKQSKEKKVKKSAVLPADDVARVASSADVNRLMKTLRTPEDDELDRLEKLVGGDAAGFEDDGLGDWLAFVDDPRSERALKFAAEEDSATDSEELRHLDAHRDDRWSGDDAALLSDDDFEELQEVEHEDDGEQDEEEEEEEQEEEEEEEEEEDEVQEADDDEAPQLIDTAPVVLAAATAAPKYVPPHMRRKEQSEMEQIRLRVKRLLNMVGPTNTVAIVKEMEQVFQSNSRNLTTQALDAELQTLCNATSLTPTLAVAFAAVLVATSTFVAFEVLSTIVELQAQRLDGAERREASNIVLLWACLYRLRALSSAMVGSVLSEEAGRLDEQSVELAMLLVRNCGSHLRRDDPAAFKSVVAAVAARRGDTDLSTRARFLIDAIVELKDNRKKQNDPLDDLVTPARKQLLTLFGERKATQPSPLRATWRDLLDAPTKGRWWLVGSAWVGQVADGGGAPASAGNDVSEATARRISAAQYSAELLALAKKQRMNTDVRRAIFCTMMDSEDFVDAHERLDKLGLRNKDQRELAHVVLHCASRERVYNPFYAHLSERLAASNGKAFRTALQYALWDKLRDVATLSATSTINLAQLYAMLVGAGCLKLKVLKIVQWALLTAPALLFFRHFFRVLLAELSPAAIERVFGGARVREVRDGVLHFLTSDFRLYMHRTLTDAERADTPLVTSLDTARKQLRFAITVLKNVVDRDDDDDAGPRDDDDDD